MYHRLRKRENPDSDCDICNFDFGNGHHDTNNSGYNVTARIGVSQGIVQHITISVIALCIVWELQYRIRLQKPPQPRIINPPIHMNQSHLIQHFMAGIPPRGKTAVEALEFRGNQRFLAQCIAPLPPGIEGQFLQD